MTEVPGLATTALLLQTRRRLLFGIGVAALIAIALLAGAVFGFPIFDGSSDDPAAETPDTASSTSGDPPPVARADLPAAGNYSIGRCGLPPLTEEERAWVKLCVNSVEVQENGQMVFMLSWQARIGEGVLAADGTPATALAKPSDVGNRNMYITDNLGNRYDFTGLGGAAEEDAVILKDQTVEGWFLFPPPQPGAKLFTFHDDDNFWAIAGVSLDKGPE